MGGPAISTPYHSGKEEAQRFQQQNNRGEHHNSRHIKLKPLHGMLQASRTPAAKRTSAAEWMQ
jgi:hypothetical protein